MQATTVLLSLSFLLLCMSGNSALTVSLLVFGSVTWVPALSWSRRCVLRQDSLLPQPFFMSGSIKGSGKFRGKLTKVQVGVDY